MCGPSYQATWDGGRLEEVGCGMKVILTNESALAEKYGDTSEIDSAVQKLIEADSGNEIETRLIALDSADAMKDVGPVVQDPTDPGQNLAAVHAVYDALTPDYIMLLGGPDVVPQQPLRNPAYEKGKDDDRIIPSDLPYACEAATSKEPRDYTAVTRVVGRLPDITGSDDPSYLVGLLDNAASASPLSATEFSQYFGISAEVWHKSSRLNVQTIFGSDQDLQLVPPRDYQWDAQLLARRAHFINCHGAPSDWRFYGQPSGIRQFPESHDGTYIPQRITPGTVVAAECCYGAQLYDPSSTHGRAGLCNVYLGNGAWGFFGSSNIAYGPADSTDWADHLCQYFWRAILEGASLGSAVLRARQKYIGERPTLDPVDLKTIAQFSLLGDPSIHPVRVAVADQPMPHGMAAGGVAMMEAVPSDSLSLATGRTERRRNLRVTGIALAESTAVTARAEDSVDDVLSNTLSQLAELVQIEDPRPLTFDVVQPEGRMAAALHAMNVEPAPTERIHLLMGRQRVEDAPAPQIVVVVAREQGGTIVNYKTAYSR